ncbi:MAG: hypothetical protein AB1555_01145 [Nitrospirota bacterium]
MRCSTAQNSESLRLRVFEAGPYLLAFDGAALLLVEMSRRKV